MARKHEDAPKILAKETQSSLLQVASRDVHISAETFPKNLVINVEVSCKIILKMVVNKDSIYRDFGFSVASLDMKW